MNPKPLTIMVIEDEELLLQAIGTMLEREQIKAILCTAGNEAINHLKTDPKLPDAIWLDYYLKDMDGLGFMNALKSNPQWKDIPVIVVSNSATTNKVSSMLALGAKKYILKAEYRLEDIIKTIRDLV